MAAGLLHEGAQTGDRIGLLSFNSHVLLESYFAVPLIGCIVMPLNVRLHPSELAGILSSLMAIEPLPFPDLMSVDETSVAELFYTSGSTGRPNSVTLSHRSIYLHALSLFSCMDHSDTQVVLHTIPLFHANGWGFPQFATMCGLTQVMVRRFEPANVFRLIEEERATIMIVVPTMAAALLGCPAHEDYDVRSLQNIIIGGAAALAELARQANSPARWRRGSNDGAWCSS